MTNHLTTATAIYEAFGRGDIPTILSHMADDVQWRRGPTTPPNRPACRGCSRAGAKRASSNFSKF
ncbi:MAG: hypothetical protein R3A44_11420 [Caldilineaceae bacterium]